MSGRKLGIALSGGGARGFAHVGVLRTLAANGIEPDLLAGVSAGSFVGGAIAAGLSIDELVEIGKTVSWLRIAGFSYSPRGLLSSAAMRTFIEKNFPVTRFEELKIPFAAVACDLATGAEIVFKDKGDMTFAIRASCAIPGVFVPMVDDLGMSLIDGGAATPVPTQAVWDMGADIVIAVDVLSCGNSYRNTPTTLVGTLFQSAMLMITAASRNQHSNADLVIEPKAAHIRPDEITRRDELIELGENAAIEMLPEINKLLAQEEVGE